MARGFTSLFVFVIATLIVKRPATGSVIRHAVNVDNNQSEISITNIEADLEVNSTNEPFLDNEGSNNRMLPVYGSTNRLIRNKRQGLFSTKVACPNREINFLGKCFTCEMYRKQTTDRSSKQYMVLCSSKSLNSF